MQLLRDGKTPEECVVQFPLSLRTIYRYQKEIQNEQTGGAPAAKKTTGTTQTQVATPGVSKDAFTPVGAPTPPPPAAPTREYVYIGPIRMPVEDWGYSSNRNLFIVADTFDIAKREYNFPVTMKVGDFVAELCQAFRIMKGWDVIGGGLVPIQAETNNGGEDNDTRTNIRSEAG
jgi:hypothetical protein